jgi:glycosyltransferase involved in cell wall biosynthesis
LKILSTDTPSRVENAHAAPAVGSAAPAVASKPKLLELCAVDFTVYHFLLPLAHALRHEFEVHFAGSDGEYVGEIRQAGFQYHTVPIKRNYNIAAHARAFVALTRLMRRERYEVVHTHTPIASLIGRAAARLSRVPVVLYTAHGFYFHERMKPHARRFFVMLEKAAGRVTDFTFTQSAEDCEDAVALGIARRDKILHIGNGVDLERFDRRRLAAERDAIRAELGIDVDRPVACIVGRLVREKGYLELIEAFSDVKRHLPDALLIAVGGALASDHDDASADIFRAARETGLAESIRFLSFQKWVERILAASDLFILPSHREGMPRSLLEAMAMGLPVVATNIRGSREAVIEGRTGRLVEVGDVRGLADAITRLLADPGLRARYGDAAEAVAKERFDERLIVQRQLDAIANLRRSLAGG